MQKFILIFLFLAGIGFIGLGLWIDTTPEQPKQTNVALIIIDALRADRLHATRNGKPVMPNLAALAQEGAEFTHAVAACSWTRPSMASVFTGVYNDAHQIRYGVKNENADNLRGDLLGKSWNTLSEYLAHHGYDNFAFVTNANVSCSIGFDQGFKPERYIFRNGARADEVTNRTLSTLPELEPPFFLYLHYMDPHVPYAPPESVWEEFGKLPEVTSDDEIIFNDFMPYYMECVNLMLGLKTERSFPELSPAGKERVWMTYDLECFFADMQVGRLVHELRNKHPDTLFVITADHGEEFWERGGMGHGTTLYEEQISIPLIVSGPGIGQQKIDSTTELIGIAPTLAAYLNLPPLKIWQGRDWFDPAYDTDAPTFARTYGPWDVLKVDLESAWQNKIKVIRDNINHKTAVYNLMQDPGEKNNIAEEHPELLEQGTRHLDEHLEENKKLRIQKGENLNEAMDPALREQLKVLGYFEDDPPQKNQTTTEEETITKDE